MVILSQLQNNFPNFVQNWKTDLILDLSDLRKHKDRYELWPIVSDTFLYVHRNSNTQLFIESNNFSLISIITNNITLCKDVEVELEVDRSVEYSNLNSKDQSISNG